MLQKQRRAFLGKGIFADLDLGMQITVLYGYKRSHDLGQAGNQHRLVPTAAVQKPSGLYINQRGGPGMGGYGTVLGPD
ncbi:hypothetical protein D3C84_1191520 [compost metagenome]